MTCFTFVASPLGRLFVEGDGHCVTGLYMPDHKHWHGPEASCRQADDAFADVRPQLAEYFAGERQRFDIPVKLEGTAFQQQVWRELMNIPFGVTITYAELARRIGKPLAVRAVGHANGRNPVSILVPCHRVIGADGKLIGYGGGLDNKQRLLELEGGVCFATSAASPLESRL